MPSRSDAIAIDWHDRPMVISPTESPTTHRLRATASTVLFMSVAADFTVTQVVDQRQGGVHGRIDKRCFPRWTGIPT